MWYIAELFFVNYCPLHLEKGQLFIDDSGVFSLEAVPVDKDRFIKEYGHPVELNIIDSKYAVLAESHELGWLSDDDGELSPLTLEDINYIINECGGVVEIKVKDDCEYTTPEFFEEKVIVKYPIYKK